ncbi:MAG: tetratricopeptide repeat protein [Ignavibacteriales bacterium]|nr:tetratricopeptide repeat protein [Ignavibacteriales bacterium]
MKLPLVYFFLFLFSFSLVAPGQDAQENAEFKLAVKLYEDKSYDLALEQFKRFSEKYSSSANAVEAKFYVGQIQIQLKQFDEARSTFQNFALSNSTNPKAPQAWMYVAEMFERTNNVKEAANAYERLKVFFPNDAAVPDALLKASNCYRRLGDTENEQRVLKTITRDYAISKAFPKARLRLVSLSIDAGNVRMAESELQKIANESGDKSIQAEALLALGNLNIHLAKFDDAEKSFRAVLEKFSTSPSAYRAQFELGKLSQQKEKYLEAIDFFKKAMKDSIDVGEEAMVETGNSFLALDDETNALAYYEQFLQKFPSSELRTNVLIQSGIASSKGKKFSKAKEYFQKAITQGNDSLKKIALKHFAESAEANKDFSLSANVYEQLATLCNDNINSPVALYRAGKVLLEHTEHYEEARRVFSLFDEKFPQHTFSDDVFFAIAVCDDSLHEYEKAIVKYSSMKKLFPSSELIDSAEQRAKFIQTYLQKDYRVAVEKLALLVGDAIGGGNKGVVAFRLGEIYFNDFKNYSAAAQQFENALKTELASEKKAEAMFFRAWSVERGAESKDAISLYEEFLKQFPSHRFAHEAAFARFLLRRKTISLQELPLVVENLLASFPLVPKKDEVILSLAKTFEQSGQIDTAKKTYLQVAEQFPTTESAEEALFRLGEIYKSNANGDSAKMFWEKELQKFPNGKFSAQAMFELGLVFLQEQNFSSNKTADELFRNIREQFYYTNYSVSSDSLELEALQREKKNDEAISLLQRMFDEQKRNLFTEGNSFSLYNKLGEIFSSENNASKTREHYLTALLLDHNSSNAAQVFFALGNLEKKEGNSDLAAAYFRQASALGATGNAQKNIADLLFETEQYVEAIRQYEELKKTAASDSLKKYYQEKIIVAKLRSDNLLGANPLFDDFKKTFASDSITIASLEIERARYFMRQSNLQTASKILDGILAKKTNDETVARTLYWRGKIYESLEKPDSAEKMYRRVISISSDADILPRAILSLGNIAYNNEQFDSAITLYQRVLTYEEKASDILPLAMSNLIEAFQSLRLYDAALKATRDFIAAFPNDESILSKKINIGVLYTRLEYYDQAILHFQKLLDDYGSDIEAEVRYDIGEAQFYKGDYQQAILEFLKVPYLVTKKTKIDWTATSLYMAGQSYEKLSKFDNAMEMYQQIIDRPGIDAMFKASAKKEIDRVKNLMKKG